MRSKTEQACKFHSLILHIRYVMDVLSTRVVARQMLSVWTSLAHLHFSAEEWREYLGKLTT